MSTSSSSQPPPPQPPPSSSDPPRPPSSPSPPSSSSSQSSSSASCHNPYHVTCPVCQENHPTCTTCGVTNGGGLVIYLTATCPICLEDDVTPLVALPCGHAFCRNDFDRLHETAARAAAAAAAMEEDSSESESESSSGSEWDTEDEEEDESSSSSSSSSGGEGEGEGEAPTARSAARRRLRRRIADYAERSQRRAAASRRRGDGAAEAAAAEDLDDAQQLLRRRIRRADASFREAHRRARAANLAQEEGDRDRDDHDNDEGDDEGGASTTTAAASAAAGGDTSTAASTVVGVNSIDEGYEGEGTVTSSTATATGAPPGDTSTAATVVGDDVVDVVGGVRSVTSDDRQRTLPRSSNTMDESEDEGLANRMYDATPITDVASITASSSSVSQQRRQHQQQQQRRQEGPPSDPELVAYLLCNGELHYVTVNPPSYTRIPTVRRFPPGTRLIGGDGKGGAFVFAMDEDDDSDSSDSEEETTWTLYHVNPRRRKNLEYTYPPNAKMIPDSKGGVWAMAYEGELWRCTKSREQKLYDFPENSRIFPDANGGVWVHCPSYEEAQDDEWEMWHVNRRREKNVRDVRAKHVKMSSDGQRGVWMLDERDLSHVDLLDNDADGREIRRRSYTNYPPDSVLICGDGRGGVWVHRRGGRRGWKLWHVNGEREKGLYWCRRNSRVVGDGKGGLWVLRQNLNDGLRWDLWHANEDHYRKVRDYLPRSTKLVSGF